MLCRTLYVTSIIRFLLYSPSYKENNLTFTLVDLILNLLCGSCKTYPASPIALERVIAELEVNA